MAKERAALKLTHGELLMVLIQRAKVTATEMAERTGYGRTYISQLYNVESFNPRQIKTLTSALGIPEQIFTDNSSDRLDALESRVGALEDENKSLKNRLRILEAENSGLRKALEN